MGTGCFVGAYTILYFTFYLLQASKSGAVLEGNTDTFVGEVGLVFDHLSRGPLGPG